MLVLISLIPKSHMDDTSLKWMVYFKQLASLLFIPEEDFTRLCAANSTLSNGLG
jgi:hypothetical protein